VIKFWGIQWHSKNKRSGEQRYLLWQGGRPLIFETRTKAREHVREVYGYLKHRKDLRSEPHGWHIPKVLRVTVSVEELK